MAAIQAWARHSSQVFKRQLKGIHETERLEAHDDIHAVVIVDIVEYIYIYIMFMDSQLETTFETYWSPRPQERLGLLLAALGDLATVALQRALVYSNYHHMFVESMHDIHAFTHM